MNTDTTNSASQGQVSPRVFGNQSAPSTISTGPASTATAAIVDPRMTVDEAPEASGYYSVACSCVKDSKGNKLPGAPTTRGFYYEAEPGKEFKAALDKLVERGFAYVG